MSSQVKLNPHKPKSHDITSVTTQEAYKAKSPRTQSREDEQKGAGD